MSALQVFTFDAGWGLPSTGPFALKLLAWLRHAGIAHVQVFENRSSRGPQGKSPWIEEGALRMGDSDAIIRHLAAQHGLPDPLAVTTAGEARNRAMAVAFEERFHQVLEWELFIHPEGYAEMRRIIAAAVPPGLGGLVAAQMRRHFRRQIHARGMGRHPPDMIADVGRRQIEGLALCLEEGGGWLGGEGPVLADFACWGQVAPMLCWPMATPVAAYAHTLPALCDWHARIMAHCFSKVAPAASA